MIYVQTDDKKFQQLTMYEFITRCVLTCDFFSLAL